ncbi:MAG: hypothetical protein SNG96_00290 [Rikenellaceae bacterium]
MILRGLILLVAVICWGCEASAQYYSWGSDHPSLRWQSIEADDFKVISPDSCDVIARNVLHYLTTLEESYGVGFTHSDLRFPVVIHPENFISNGMAMWMPGRVEFLSTPSEDNHSSLWIKHLAAHEYRHVVHYNNLNQGFIKWLSYLLGEQGAAAGYAFMPLYAIEGDAVMFETQAVSFGRALQPSFSMAYRAIGDDILKGGKYHQKWFAGSYREHIPDHYELGYQLTSYGYTKYGIDMWDRVFAYAVRHPYVVATTRRAMKKYYDTTIPELFDETFENLNQHWDSLPKAENYAQVISEPKEKNYTIYSHPLFVDSTRVIALKKDFDNPSHFVLFDTESGEEQRVKYTGYLSSRPDFAAGRVWWSEYRRSLLFDEKWNSRLCYLDVESGKSGTVSSLYNALYPTAIGDSREHYAYVEYHYSGRYSIVEVVDGKEVMRINSPLLSEIHGLAWDDTTRSLYAILTTEDGMWLGRCQSDDIQPITEAAYITLSDLRAGGGYLYFGSIASGRDEIHRLDIATGEQVQLTSSSYGAFDSSTPSSTGKIALTTYDRLGYHLSTQSEDDMHVVVAKSKLPLNIVNPTRAKLDVVNLDTVRFTAADSLLSVEKSPSKKFRKGANAINLHSWAPIKYNPFSLSTSDVGLGATLLSQNLLSTASSYLAYGWNSEDKSTVEAGATFSGLGLQFDFSALWGGYQDIYSYYSVPASITGGVDTPVIPDAKHRYKFSGAVTLPLYFSGGYFNSSLYLSSGFSYSNDMVQSFSGYENYVELADIYNASNGAVPQQLLSSLLSEVEQGDYNQGLSSLSFTASHSRLSRMGYRDSYPRLGYSLAASYMMNPMNSDFSSLFVSLATIYLPGVAKNHSLRLSASYQNNIGGYKINGYSVLGYQSSAGIPVGYTTSDFSSRNFTSTTINYSLPICYPNIGIPSTIFLKRVRANLGAGYGRYDSATSNSGAEQIYSYGGDLSLDFTPLRLPDAATTTVTFSLYKPHGKSLYFAFGMSLPL